MARYVLSKKSEEDIESIYDYGKRKFGKDRAILYLSEMGNCFENLSENPQIGRSRNEIKKELYSFPYISHVIFYRILKNHIRIIRILHGSRDLRRFLQ